MTRANPFDDLSDFELESAPKPVEPRAIEIIAEEAGFPSRKAKSPRGPDTAAALPDRRRRTGRNQQINIKATSETIDRFYRIADECHQPLGAVLELALDALEKAKR